jgi:hypothetical protein
MKTWTRDNRPVVWTVNETNTDRYDLYIRGVLYAENLSFEEFYPLYKSFSNMRDM